MAYRITLENMAGPIDSRDVETEEEIKAAVLDMIDDVDHLQGGDLIRVVALED